MNAFDTRSLIEDGYGYRGALEGHFRNVGFIADQLGPFNELFGQVFARASRMREGAQELRRTVENAAPNVDEVRVPLYSTARRVTDTALSVLSADRLVLAGTPMRDLDLPSEQRWTVGGVNPWSPQRLQRPSCP